MFPKEIRKLRKYSLKAAADEMGTSLVKYLLYEIFPDLMPVETAYRFVRVMNVSVDDIFFNRSSILNRIKQT